jgi:hypothetical protein
MKDFFKKYKTQSIVGAYICIVCMLFYFLVVPTINEIKNSANKINQGKIISELNEERLANVVTMEDNYNKFIDNEENFNIVIEPNSEVDLIKELESIAEQTGNRIEFKIQENVDDKLRSRQKIAENDIKGNLKNSNYLSMLIAIEGDHSGLVNFIHKIENYKKTINIISISSEKKEISGDSRISNSVDVISSEKEVINSIFDVVVYIKK